MGTKANPGNFDCYEAAEDDEPMFVLLARDEQAPALVRQWAMERIALATGALQFGLPSATYAREIDKAHEAVECARAMEAWRAEHR